ncbi:MAG: flavin reductase family protein [Eggerthellales bacterium]|nr:flavin reductase family protein [Eggerthellales bacterium]
MTAPALPRPLTPPPVAPPAVKDPNAAPRRGDWQQVHGRDVAALLDPRPTLVVGARGTHEMRKEVGFATILWAMPVSHEPAMVAIALREKSHTMHCLKDAGSFSLNVLPANETGTYLAQVCGTRTGWTRKKVGMVPHHQVTVEYDKTQTIEVEVPRFGIFRRVKTEERVETVHHVEQVPVLDAATSWMTCQVDHIEEAGDHLLVVAYVLEAHTCAPRNPETELLEPEDALLCVQHGAWARSRCL